MIRRDTVVLRHGRMFRWSIQVTAFLLAGASAVALASLEALTTGRVEFDVTSLPARTRSTVMRRWAGRTRG